MDTLAQATVSDPETLQDRIEKVRAVIAEVETSYAGGLTPEPWAA